MTDEEKAEEYVKSVIDVNAFDWKIVREIALAYLAGLKAGKDKNIKDLKEDNKVMSDNYSKMEQKFYDNLTQAKELLARWVSDKPYTVSEQKDLISDTEQFLKEE